MKKIISFLLVLSLLLGNCISFAEVKANSIKFTTKSTNINNQLIANKIPQEVRADINRTIENLKKKGNTTATIEVRVLESSSEAAMATRATVSYRTIESIVNLQPIDTKITKNQDSINSWSSILITTLSELTSKVYESASIYTTGLSILAELQRLFGSSAITAESVDYVKIEGSSNKVTTHYTYCNLNDGMGERLGLTSQKVDNLNVRVVSHYFNQQTRTWYEKVQNTLSNKNYTSTNYYNPNPTALRNVQLNMSSDERFCAKLGSYVLQL